MLRVICSENAAHAKNYYTSNLKYEADPSRLGKYYGQEQEVIGEWQGKGAELLGLTGRVDQKSFEALCDNKRPGSGDKLTARTNDHRRVGYDFNFNCPKSVSVVHALTGDERVLIAFRESVSETMAQIESDMKTRVRAHGADEDRKTGNLIWGEFIHFTARPVEGRPDPHLHAHCYAFNATYDPMEEKWKAGQFGDIKRDAEYYEAAFHARLAKKVGELGYTVGRSGDWWEIKGLSRETLEKFSQRTEKIVAAAKEGAIDDAAAKDKLAALTREKKVKTSMSDLKREWADRLTPDEKQSLSGLLGHQQNQVFTARESMDYALTHCHERTSVVTDKALVTEALWHGMGHVDVAQVERQLLREDILTQDMDGRRWCTTKEVLREEWENINFVKRGYSQCRPLNIMPYTLQNPQLGQDQKDAVRHVMTSADRVMATRGPAGAGKTTMMQEAVAGIEAGGHKVFTFAPSAESSRGTLRKEGFQDAQTVAHLLKNESLHPQLRGQVLWIDEAGLLSARQMHGIFQLAEKQDCRVILSGDTAQHTSVERGDALRLLEAYAGLKAAQLTEMGLPFLNLSNNRFTQVPGVLSKIQGMTYLNLSGNQIAEIPLLVSSMVTLQQLDFARNRLTTIPDLRNTHITRLDLSGNQITAFPPSKDFFPPNLRELNLQGNKIAEVPDWIFETNISFINLGGNVLPDAQARAINDRLRQAAEARRKQH